MKPKLKELYPPIEPYKRGKLRVSALHSIYYEECGNPKGKPVVFLHGGPGGGIEPVYRRYFNPRKWRIILFDQRGCGRSTPYAELRENTTWDLVEDIEKLRRVCGVEKWHVFGGSWGSTLALAYAETHPARCLSLTLRGIFLMRRSELLWFYQEGASHVFPDAWDDYLAPIPPKERGDLIRAYHKRLTGRDKKAQIRAARAWSIWEGRTSKLFPNPDMIQRFSRGHWALAFARIENHYMIHGGFMKPDDRLLRNARRLRKIPAVIVQGRYDMPCPARSAWDLHKAWPEAEFVLVPDAGHSMTEPGIRDALLRATDKFARL